MAAKRRSSGKGKAAAPDKAAEASLRDYLQTEGAGFLRRPEVTSVGLGYKRVNGRRTKQLAIQFTVDDKIAPEVLERLGVEALPESIEIDGTHWPTDVLERSYRTSLRPVGVREASDEDAERRQRRSAIDPIVPGVSVGHTGIPAGTAGCVIHDRRTDEPYLLSNWHVLHTPLGELGDAIVQPGRHDDNRTDRNVVGTLVRSAWVPPATGRSRGSSSGASSPRCSGSGSRSRRWSSRSSAMRS